MQINFQSKKIQYSIKSSPRARSVRLSVYPDGSCVVTVPQYAMRWGRIGITLSSPEKIAENFVMKKADWILEKIAHFEKRAKRYATDAYAGGQLTGQSGGKKMTKRGEKAHYAAHKARALAFVTQKVAQWNANTAYNFSFKKISVKNQKTRWGSCSRHNNLSFNYKIAFLPEHLADYIVVHELCHLGQFNHSAKFWELVEQASPKYRSHRKELRHLGMRFF